MVPGEGGRSPLENPSVVFLEASSPEFGKWFYVLRSLGIQMSRYEKTRPPSPVKHFLVFGNGRTGSTYLMSCINRTSNIFSAGEMKWVPEYKPIPNVHLVFDFRSETIESSLKNLLASHSHERQNIMNFGSKLIFDPYVYQKPEVFSCIAEKLGSIDYLLFIYRSYLEQFVSWNTKNLTHEIDESMKGVFDAGIMAKLLEMDHQIYPKEIHLHRSSEDTPSTKKRNNESSTNCVMMPYYVAIDKMLMYFCYDLFSFGEITKKQKAFPVEYSKLTPIMAKILGHIDAEFGQETLEDIVSKPFVFKQPDHKGYLKDPLNLMEQLSDCLFGEMEAFIREGRKPEDIWTWTGPDRASISVKGIGRIIGAGFCQDDNTVSVVDDDTVLWRCCAPVRTLEDSKRILAGLAEE